jgi:TolA-binding protein
MKSFITSVVTAIVFTSGFAATASAASFSEAPEYSTGVSTLSRATVAAAALGAASVSEATQISTALSTLSRDEVCKDVVGANSGKFNELTASNLN